MRILREGLGEELIVLVVTAVHRAGHPSGLPERVLLGGHLGELGEDLLARAALLAKGAMHRVAIGIRVIGHRGSSVVYCSVTIDRIPHHEDEVLSFNDRKVSLDNHMGVDRKAVGMGQRAVFALRVVIAIAVAGSLVVQVAMVALLPFDEDTTTLLGVAVAVIGVLGVVCLQVIAVCIWRLLTMVRRGTVFSHRAFPYVDGVIGAIAAGSVLILAIAVVAWLDNRATPPGGEDAPGLVVLIGGLSLVAAGVALVVYVLRVLLAQAVALDSEAKHLQSELDGVI